MTLHLFEKFGIELEYMIVDRQTLKIRPMADKLLREGEKVKTETEHGKIAWSNELVQHLIELKTNGPVKRLEGLDKIFQQNIARINRTLTKDDAALMPTAMHPFMDPHTETKIWKHEYTKVYRTYDRIFSCKGHGWSNLQSTHINLPFGNNEEFITLHDAIRLVLPILPAIAASSPIVEGKATGIHDNRMVYYRDNSKMIPSITGGVIPEQIRSIDDYHTKILRKMYKDIAPHDPDKVLQYEWLNARGAIARFDRGAIEIRMLDIQECPKADIAIAWVITELLKQLINKKAVISTTKLRKIFLDCMRHGEHSPVSKEYAHLIGKTAESAGDLWKEVINGLPASENKKTAIQIARKGTLSTRILKSADKNGIDKTYRRLTRCLAEGKLF